MIKRFLQSVFFSVLMMAAFATAVPQLGLAGTGKVTAVFDSLEDFDPVQDSVLIQTGRNGSTLLTVCLENLVPEVVNGQATGRHVGTYSEEECQNLED